MLAEIINKKVKGNLAIFFKNQVVLRDFWSGHPKISTFKYVVNTNELRKPV